MQPEIHEVPGGYNLVWPDIEVRATVRRLYEARGKKALHGEIHYYGKHPDGSSFHIYQGSINLVSPNAKQGFERELRRQYPQEQWRIQSGANWTQRLEWLCAEVLKRARRGQPVVNIGASPVRTGQVFRVYPFIPENVITALFGPGASCKSYFALLLALLVQAGKDWGGLRVNQGNVLYLDYEASKDDLNERSLALQAGLSLPPTEIKYRLCSTPLDTEIDQIAIIVEREAIDFLVLDSVGMSLSGTANEDHTVQSFYRAIRSLETTTLVVDHPAKGWEKKVSQIGSVYKSLEARQVWKLLKRQQPGDDKANVVLYHEKVNDGRLLPAMGFSFSFRNGQNDRIEWVGVKRDDKVKREVGLIEGLTITEQILEVLKEGELSSKEIASELSQEDNKVRSYLSRLNERELVIKKGNLWGLRSRVEEVIPF